MNEKNDKQEKSIWQELREAGLPYIAFVTLAIVAVYVLGLLLSQQKFETLGQFGDSFGALTSLLNALAFAAVVATVVLQSRELRESRVELSKQAEAQAKWAEAAMAQIELTKELEAVRIRPFIKVEWRHPPDNYCFCTLQIRNVGLGVAIVRAVELVVVPGRQFGVIRSHEELGLAMEKWRQCIEFAAGSTGNFDLDLAQFNDLNRTLAPGEPQALLTVAFEVSDAEKFYFEVTSTFRPVIHFESGNGEKLTTGNQFDEEWPGQRKPRRKARG